jgi:hypothetical protein
MTNTTNQSSSFANRVSQASIIAVVGGVAAWALSAGAPHKDAAGQRVETVAAATAEACATRGVHLVDNNGRDLDCPAGTQQDQVQVRATAAAYVMPAGL